jgi:hypothetical protein
MADIRKIVKVFLASPGDLQEERRAAKLVVDEFNKLWADKLGYHVELVGWEDTVSAYGRPQSIINRDLERCEFFIGMMWKRWGTPPDLTGTYTSGFEEEFDGSIKRRQTAGRPEISLLFKNVDNELLRDPGPELAKVILFKSKIISEKIILFETFDDIREFEVKIRGCITTYVKGLQAEEAEKLSDSNQASRSDDGATQRSVDQTLSTDTPLSIEGAEFLRDFIAKTERDPDKDSISAVDVARFRLLAGIIGAQENDQHLLGAHDANLLFANRSALALSHREIFGLIDCGVGNFSSENIPLWYWNAEIDGFRQRILSLISMFGTPAQRTGALSAMRLISETTVARA